MNDEQTPPEGTTPDPTVPEGAGTGADPTVPPEPSAVCSTCQATLDADQTYCLECGAPTPLAPALRKRQRGLIAAATGALLLGGGAGALAYHLGSSGDGSGSGSVTSGGVDSTALSTATVGTLSADPTLPTDGTVATVDTAATGASTDVPVTDTTDTGSTETSGDTGTGVGTAPPDTSGLTADSTDSTQSTDSTESTESTESTDTTTDLTPSSDDWPAGTDNWTVQVSSVRKRSGADRLVKRMTAAGKKAGVLVSADHEGFKRSGYFVVFSGNYETKAEAVAAQVTLGGGFGRTIVRRVRS